VDKHVLGVLSVSVEGNMIRNDYKLKQNYSLTYTNALK
jgi:hypothetical protein